jgi:hypothetical protein
MVKFRPRSWGRNGGLKKQLLISGLTSILIRGFQNTLKNRRSLIPSRNALVYLVKNFTFYVPNLIDKGMSITLNSTINNQFHLRDLTAQPRQSHKHYVINLLLYKIIQC